MKELKCKSCGGLLTVDEDKDFGTCPYCKTQYKLNDDKTISFKMDENTKESIAKGYKLFGKISLAVVIPAVIIPLVIIFLAVYIFISLGNKFDKENYFDKFSSQFDKINSTTINIKTTKEETTGLKQYEIDSFNFSFESYAGTKMGATVFNLIDDIVTNNKKNSDRLITVIYGDINTTDPTTLINMKSKMDKWSDYEVIIDYGENKLVNKVTIENR